MTLCSLSPNAVSIAVSYSAGVRSPGFDNQIREGSKVAQNVVVKLDQLSSDMVSKIQTQEKVNSNW